MKLFVVVTNYNNSDYTISAYNSLKNSVDEFSSFTFVVVDNGSSGSEFGKLQILSDSGVLVLRSEKNLGYFPGLNLGIASIKHLLDEQSVLYVGNNDVQFPSDIAKQLVTVKSVLSSYPVLSPDIRTLHGEPQNPHVIKNISPIRNLLYDLYHTNYLSAKLMTWIAGKTRKLTRRGDELHFEEAGEIYQGYGAMYVLTPVFFKYFDTLPEDSFLMYEEFFLAHQLKERGYKTYYEPRLTLVHCCKGATGSMPGKLKWQYSKIAHRKYRKLLKSYEGK